MREVSSEYPEDPNQLEAQRALKRSVMSFSQTVGQIGEPVIANPDSEHFETFRHTAEKHGVTLPPDVQVGRHLRVHLEGHDNNITATYIGSTFGEVAEFPSDDHAPIATVDWIADVYPHADDEKRPGATVWGRYDIYATDWDDQAGHQSVGVDVSVSVEYSAGQHEPPPALADLWRDMHLEDIYPFPDEERLWVGGRGKAHHIDAITSGMQQGEIDPEVHERWGSM